MFAIIYEPTIRKSEYIGDGGITHAVNVDHI